MQWLLKKWLITWLANYVGGGLTLLSRHCLLGAGHELSIITAPGSGPKLGAKISDTSVYPFLTPSIFNPLLLHQIKPKLSIKWPKYVKLAEKTVRPLTLRLI
jgi:hypothetical protein